MAYPNPPRTWPAGAVLTAAQLNAELRDALNIVIPTASTTLAWGSYTPTLTQSATVTKTVSYAKYFQIGKVVIVNLTLAVTGAGTANNAIVIGLPVTAAGTTGVAAVGSGYVNDTSAGTNYTAVAVLGTTTTFQLFGPNGLALGSTSSSMTAALASGDSVQVHAVYEAA